MSKFGRTTAFMSAGGYSVMLANVFIGAWMPSGLGDVGQLLPGEVHCDQRVEIHVSRHADRMGVLLAHGLCRSHGSSWGASQRGPDEGKTDKASKCPRHGHVTNSQLDEPIYRRTDGATDDSWMNTLGS